MILTPFFKGLPDAVDAGIADAELGLTEGTWHLRYDGRRADTQICPEGLSRHCPFEPSPRRPK